MEMRPKSEKTVEVETYLNNLVSNFNPGYGEKHEFELRVFIISSDEANAFIFPNGAIFITLPMLLSLDSEAELYSVLAHEYSHFVLRHSYKLQVHNQNAAQLASVAGLLLGALATAYSGYDLIDTAQSVTQVFAIASSSGFSKSAELEADKLGISLLIELGVDPTQGLNIFRKIQNENPENINFLSTHPKWKKRITSYTLALAEKAPSTDFPVTNNSQFRLAMGYVDALIDAPTHREHETLAHKIEAQSEQVLAILEILNRNTCPVTKDQQAAYDSREIGPFENPSWFRNAMFFNSGINARNQGRYQEAFVCFYNLNIRHYLRPEANFYIGELFEAGNGVPRDEKRAKYFYRKAASAGYDKASMKLLDKW